jgi:hypothetical protein
VIISHSDMKTMETLNHSKNDHFGSIDVINRNQIMNRPVNNVMLSESGGFQYGS